MMTLLTRYKNILIALLVATVGFFAYSMFFTDGNETAALSVQQVDPSETAVEQELITLLLQLKSIRLDPAFLDDEKFKSLQDFGQTLVPEPSGRTNPFSPLE